LNLDVVQAIRAAKRQSHATPQQPSWHFDHLAVIRAFLAARRGPREIEHHLEGFRIRYRASYILSATAATCYQGRACRSHTRKRRRYFPPLAQLAPAEQSTRENNARCSSVQNESLAPPCPGSDSMPIELSKTFAARAEMINPWINFRNRDLMSRHALEKL
jgi:hypothetical protein